MMWLVPCLGLVALAVSLTGWLLRRRTGRRRAWVADWLGDDRWTGPDWKVGDRWL